MKHRSLPFRLAYLTGTYPAASHTFIEREIAALRALGSDICITSIRKPADSELIGPEEVAARDETFYVLPVARNPLQLLSAHASAMARNTRCWFKTLGLALRTHRPGARGFLWQLFYFLEAGVLARHLRQQEVTHLHNHFADSSATVAMLAASLCDVPFSFTLHGPTELFAPESWHLGEKVARADLVICISHFARSQVMLFSEPRHWHKLRIVHCGVTPDRYDGDPLRTDDRLRLLFVGRLAPVKGLRVLLEAFEQAKAYAPEISLMIVGDGEDRAWVDEAASRVGGIEVLGYKSQSEVAGLLGQSDVLVLPSFAEGVPVALMEAMAAGRPVIATRVGGVAELVEDGISGRLVPPGDAQTLATAMVEMAKTGATRNAMGRAGRAKVHAEFDINQEAVWLKALFEGRAGLNLRPEINSAEGG